MPVTQNYLIFTSMELHWDGELILDKYDRMVLKQDMIADHRVARLQSPYYTDESRLYMEPPDRGTVNTFIQRINRLKK